MIGTPVLRAAEIPFAAGPGISASPFRVVGVTDLLNEPIPSPLFSESIAVEHGLTGVIGQPGSGKTMFVTNAVLAIASGETVHGLHPLQQGPCLYLDAERSFALRLKSAAASVGIDPATLPIFGIAGDLLDLHKPASVNAFIDAVRRVDVRPVLTVIDTMPLHFGGDENGPDMNLGVRHLKELSLGIGGAVVALMHPAKATPEIERGHTSFRGAADYMLLVARTDDTVTVTTSKNRYGPSGDVVGRFRICQVPEIDRGAVLRLAGAVVDDGALSDRDLTAWAALPPDGGITFSDWEARATGAGLSTSQFTRSRTRLETLNRVRRQGALYIRN